jgi:hypothetical protein
MRATDGLLGIETVRDGPFSPDAGNCGSRVDQHTIKVKEQSFARNFQHD